MSSVFPSYSKLADELVMRQSEVHSAVKRLKDSRLIYRAEINEQPGLIAVHQFRKASNDVRLYIADKMKSWLKNDIFIDALPGHLGSASDYGRLGIVLKRLKKISSLAEVLD